VFCFIHPLSLIEKSVGDFWFYHFPEVGKMICADQISDFPWQNGEVFHVERGLSYT
jgi:hypothetical protein